MRASITKRMGSVRKEIRTSSEGVRSVEKRVERRGMTGRMGRRKVLILKKPMREMLRIAFGGMATEKKGRPAVSPQRRKVLGRVVLSSVDLPHWICMAAVRDTVHRLRECSFFSSRRVWGGVED